MNKFSIACFLFLLISGCQQPSRKESTSYPDRKWWKEGIIYQIYPRSFYDSNGDGVGDFRGIIEKLDYLESLGITMVWMNPFYDSPNVDNGYDVSNYRAILPAFGTMNDFDTLLQELHKRNIRFVLDVVVNHSSDQHEWFKQSRSSRDNPYRDYYHWWPAEKGKPNYRFSLFDEKGDAWQFDSTTNAWYLHYFAKEQPDLNWENPKVRQEVYDIMKFWAEKGVDGFRLDAFQYVSKDTTFPPLPEGFEKDVIRYYGMGPNLHTYLREMYNEVLSKYDVFAVSEGVGSTFQDAHDLVDASRNELQMAYHFKGMDVGNSLERYTLSEFKKVYTEWDSAFAQEGWLSIFLANHDVPRMVSKFGNDSPVYREASAKMLNTFLLSMRGTPYCYYGDELGMTNANFERIEQYQDISAINSYKKALAEGQDMELFMKTLTFLSRDNGRTPMQWDTTRNAGFTNGNPWLPVNKNYRQINVTVQNQDPNSVLNHFRRMTKLRRENPVLVYGAYTLVEKDHPTIYAYTRELDGEKMLIALNFSDGQQVLNTSLVNEMHELVINNYPSLDISNGSMKLEPYQAIILRIKSS